MMKSCCGRIDTAPIDRSLAEERRYRRRAAAPDDLGEVDHQKTDRERAHHPHVAARPQERQHVNRSATSPSGTATTNDRRQHNSGWHAVLDESAKRSSIPPSITHMPSAKVQRLRGHEGEAVADGDEPVDRSGREPARARSAERSTSGAGLRRVRGAGDEPGPRRAGPRRSSQVNHQRRFRLAYRGISSSVVDVDIGPFVVVLDLQHLAVRPSRHDHVVFGHRVVAIAW